MKKILLIFILFIIQNLSSISAASAQGSGSFAKAETEYLKSTLVRCWVHLDVASYAAVISKATLNKIGINGDKMPMTDIELFEKYGILSHERKTSIFRAYNLIAERYEVGDALTSLAKNTDPIYISFKKTLLGNEQSISNEFNIESLFCHKLSTNLSELGSKVNISLILKLINSTMIEINSMHNGDLDIIAEKNKHIWFGNMFASLFWRASGYPTTSDNLKSNKYHAK